MDSLKNANSELIDWMRDVAGRLSLALTLLVAAIGALAAGQRGGFTPELEQKVGQYWLTGLVLCFGIFVLLLLKRIILRK